MFLLFFIGKKDVFVSNFDLHMIFISNISVDFFTTELASLRMIAVHNPDALRSSDGAEKSKQSAVQVTLNMICLHLKSW